MLKDKQKSNYAYRLGYVEAALGCAIRTIEHTAKRKELPEWYREKILEPELVRLKRALKKD